MDFSKVDNTIIVSDIHLADAEPPHPKNPLWKRYKRPKHFVDRSFKRFLESIQESAQGSIELVLNGDILDFDSVMAMPAEPGFNVSWLEKQRGLAAEESKSRFKLKVIMDDHPVWFEAIRNFILAGHRVIFVIGNHDIELHWPSVRNDLLNRLDLPEVFRDHVRFCEWFYISNQDTLIEHGNQYDAYCLCSNPVNPLIRKGQKIFVRIPFGNLAGKFLLNGMGLMNPHVDSSYIKNSIREYLVFYYRYMMRTQPLLVLTWIWSALVTLVYSIGEGLLPAMTDPMTIHSKVEEIAARSNATPNIAWSLRELHAHPAIFDPIKILKELWLDRAILLILIFLGSFQFFTVMNVFLSVSVWWFIFPLLFLTPAFIFYARSVESDVDKTQKATFNTAPLSARIAKVNRVVHGHIHRERHTRLDGVEYLNTGTWSPAYHDVECTQPYGRKCFAWIKPDESGGRSAELYEWKDPGVEMIPFESMDPT